MYLCDLKAWADNTLNKQWSRIRPADRQFDMPALTDSEIAKKHSFKVSLVLLSLDVWTFKVSALIPNGDISRS